MFTFIIIHHFAVLNLEQGLEEMKKLLLLLLGCAVQVRVGFVPHFYIHKLYNVAVRNRGFYRDLTDKIIERYLFFWCDN